MSAANWSWLQRYKGSRIAVKQMADVLTTITHLINSPPGQLAAGGVLAGIVWKFFERVEALLTDDTKLEIAIWLLDRKAIGPTVQNWPTTVTKLFNRVWGDRHFSWKCLWRSSLASYVLGAAIMVVTLVRLHDYTSLRSVGPWRAFVILGFVSSVIPDYISLLETRGVLAIMKRIQIPIVWSLFVCIDIALTFATGWLGTYGMFYVCARYRTFLFTHALVDLPRSGIAVLATIYGVSFSGRRNVLLDVFWNTPYLIFPTFFTSVWLWLYAGSGFVLKAARRFDIGFDWFNRKFDIEKKPLQSIGLVAGVLVAVVYWASVFVSWVTR